MALRLFRKQFSALGASKDRLPHGARVGAAMFLASVKQLHACPWRFLAKRQGGRQPRYAKAREIGGAPL
jgi:hypothetical protein